MIPSNSEIRSAVLAITLLLLSGHSAWADHGHNDGLRNEEARFHEHRSREFVTERPVYTARSTYYSSAAPVYDSAATYYPPQTYYEAPPAAPAPVPIGALTGMVAGAAIGNDMAHGHDRTAAIAIGSILGAIIGNHLANGQ